MPLSASMSSSAASPARTSPSPASKPAWPVRVPACGRNTSGSSENSSHGPSSSRTSLASTRPRRKGPTTQEPTPDLGMEAIAQLVDGVWMEMQQDLFEPGRLRRFSGDWPRTGLMRSGRIYPLPRLAPLTDDSASSSSESGENWPPAAAMDGSNGVKARRETKGHHALMLSHLANSGVMEETNPISAHAEAIRTLWPTPEGMCGGKTSRGGDRKDELLLTGMVKQEELRTWPTPTESDSAAAGNRNLEGSKAHPGVSLTDAVSGGQQPRRWSTPRPSDVNIESRSAEALERERQRPNRGASLILDVTDQRNWPTPRAEDSESSGARVSRGTADTLTAATRDWMTPQSRDWKGISQAPATKGTYSGGLPDQLQELENRRTPQAYAAPAGMGKPTSTPLDQQMRSQAGLVAPESRSKGGNLPASSVVLNPAWVSCLMGFPADWCDIGDVPLPRSGTPSSRRSAKSSRDGSRRY